MQRQGGADDRQPVLAERHPQQHPLQAGHPGVLPQVAQAVPLAVPGRQPPAHPGLGRQLAEPLQGVGVESEAGGDRRLGAQVEHLGEGGPGLDDAEQLDDEAQQRIAVGRAPVGQLDPEVVGRVPPGNLGGQPERGGDQGRGRVQVGAADGDVPGLQRRVGGQQAGDRVAQDLDLPVEAVPGVQLHAAVRGRWGARAPRQATLQPAQGSG